MCKQKIKTGGEEMTEKCSKENEINSLFKSQNENQKSLIKIETLLDSLIKYQISEQKEAIVSTRTELSSLDKRIARLENLTFKIIASAAAGKEKLVAKSRVFLDEENIGAKTGSISQLGSSTGRHHARWPAAYHYYIPYLIFHGDILAYTE